MAIKEFRGEYRWLSNFHLANVKFEGLTYMSTEHAYQAAKSNDLEIREMIAIISSCGLARKAGQLIPLADDWHTTRKFEVMNEVVRTKFNTHEDLADKLLATGDQELIEGTTWHDNCWGSCICNKCGNQGQNHLGKILMAVREELRSKR